MSTTMAPDPDGRLRVSLHHVRGDDNGYGRVGAALAAALRDRGVEVDDVTSPGERPPGGPPPVALWLSSPFHATGAWTGQRLVAITMWETDRLPSSFVDALEHFSTVLVPSDENLDLFRAHHGDVRRLSFGVDAARWTITPRPPANDGFRFLIAGTGTRKGIDLAHDAFHAAFPAPAEVAPRPHLVIKGARNECYRDGDVSVVAEPLTPGAERALYDSAHCYVQPSRGEGFGLQPLQAISMGIPTILTNAHGHRAYAHLGIGVPARPVPADLFALAECGSWWEADVHDLARSMRWVHQHYDAAVSGARWAAGRAARDHTWAGAADSLVRILDGDGERSRSLDPGATWRSFDHPRYPVITRRDITVPMAGDDHVFVAGVERMAPAQVKRLLFEGGALDDRCLDLPLRRLDDAELAALDPARRAEYLDWVVEAKRLPPRLAARARQGVG